MLWLWGGVLNPAGVAALSTVNVGERKQIRPARPPLERSRPDNSASKACLTADGSRNASSTIPFTAEAGFPLQPSMNWLRSNAIAIPPIMLPPSLLAKRVRPVRFLDPDLLINMTRSSRKIALPFDG